MSTGNFDSRQKFGLYVFSPSSYTEEYQICEECGSFNIMENELCDVCNTRLEDCKIEIECDYMYLADDCIPQMRNSWQDLNCMFHTLNFKDGYYEGVQLDIEEIYEFEEMEDIYTARYEFGLYPSQAKKKYRVEERKIEKWLSKIVKGFPISQYQVDYVFSNGETGYSKVV